MQLLILFQEPLINLILHFMCFGVILWLILQWMKIKRLWAAGVML